MCISTKATQIGTHTDSSYELAYVIQHFQHTFSLCNSKIQIMPEFQFEKKKLQKMCEAMYHNKAL